ncbi:MAG: tRNA (N6-threonylcarbamoyladenosine(37)-N6)-methyltransferase TrmO [Aquisalimonadaceae bacterium]
MAPDTASAELAVIGTVRGGFDDRFGTPRQPGLAPSAVAELMLHPPHDQAEALRGLETCSHVWLLFLFHCTAAQGWRPTVRPPRLGGNRRIGVFASRSPFRPNPVGLSVVELEGLILAPGRCGLRFRNHDLVDGTPVIDIKPYLPWSDALPEARPPAGFEAPPANALQVVFSEQAERACLDAERAGVPLADLVSELLSQDPRPAYRRQQSDRWHGMLIRGRDVRWTVEGGIARVVEIRPPGAP